ncbi:hypothetical protein J0910_20540 [Nocardiopsis sp. CNT-189]|uniref:DUF5691 domain-containing protein n=1 Tax=Nocardiopsis oceanisediminis TaxID=2816862 RepID=UPI003B2BA641
MDDPPPVDAPWPELLSAALVGTARTAVPGPPVPEGRAALELLDRAAAAVVRERAGVRPGAAEPLPPARAEALPAAPPAAGARLEALLAEERYEQAGEWLRAAAGKGLLAPPQVLPALLDAAARRGDGLHLPDVLRVCGERGRWLARLEPRWSFADPPRDAAAALPGEDRWGAASAGERRRILAALEPHLSPGHEAFLRAALADPGPGVRALALSLLARLPGSGHGRTLAALARRHVRPGGRAPVVRPPDLRDAGLAAALGLRPGARPGVRSEEVGREWLWTLVGHAPLDAWLGHLGADRAEVVRAAGRLRGWDLLEALANAAVVQRDPGWAAALLGPIMDRLLLGHSVHGSRGPALMRLAPPEDRAGWALRRLGGRGAADPGSAPAVLERVPGPWAGPLAARAARIVERADRSRPGGRLDGLCRTAALRLPPEMHGRPGFAPRPGDPPEAAAALRGLTSTLRSRHEMHEELD